MTPEEKKKAGNYLGSIIRMWKMGQKNAAYKLAQKAVENFPEYPHLLSKKADIETKMGDFDSAVQTFTQLAKIDPSSITLTGLANVQYRNGQAQDAVETCEAALRIDPENIRTITVKANAHLSLFDFDGFDKTIAIVRNPKLEIIQYLIARKYFAQDKRAQCINILRPLMQGEFKAHICILYLAASTQNDPMVALLRRKLGEKSFQTCLDKAIFMKKDPSQVFDDLSYKIPASPVTNRPEFTAKGATNKQAALQIFTPGRS